MAERIEMGPGGLVVPDEPIVPFIEGDGIGPDIWVASQRVFDAAVDKAYGGSRRIEWLEVLAGEKAYQGHRGVAAGGNHRHVPQSRRRDQRSAHHSYRWGDSITQRWRSARFSISTCVCALSVGIRECPRR